MFMVKYLVKTLSPSVFPTNGICTPFVSFDFYKEGKDNLTISILTLKSNGNYCLNAMVK